MEIVTKQKYKPITNFSAELKTFCVESGYYTYTRPLAFISKEFELKRLLHHSNLLELNFNMIKTIKII